VLTPESVASKDEESFLSLDVLLGMQLGIRSQVAVCREAHRAYVAEAFYGLIFTRNMGSAEGAGFGGRVLFRRCAEGSLNSLVLGPGMEVLYQFPHNGAVLAAPTVDLSWFHSFGARGGFELGLNAGVGLGLAGHDGDRGVSGRVTPLISAYTGFRF
jgi:hypothetical protein